MSSHFEGHVGRMLGRTGFMWVACWATDGLSLAHLGPFQSYVGASLGHVVGTNGFNSAFWGGVGLFEPPANEICAKFPAFATHSRKGGVTGMVLFTRNYIEQIKMFNVIPAMRLSTSSGKKGWTLSGNYIEQSEMQSCINWNRYKMLIWGADIHTCWTLTADRYGAQHL